MYGSLCRLDYILYEKKMKVSVGRTSVNLHRLSRKVDNSSVKMCANKRSITFRTFLNPVLPFPFLPTPIARTAAPPLILLKMTGDEGRDGVTWTSAELLLLRRGIRDNGVDDWRTLGDWSKVTKR